MKTLLTWVALFTINLGFAQTVGSGNALNFGTQLEYVEIAQNWPITSFPFTATAWIKAQVQTSYTSSPIVASHTSLLGYAGFTMHLVLSGGSWYLEGRLGAGTTGFASQTRRSKLVPFNHFNRWCHVAIVYNSLNSIDIYINGVLQSGSISGSASSYNFNGSGLPRIGYTQSNPPNVQSFRGDIDEVSVWSIGLTQTQIRALMCKSIPTNAPGLVSYYKLNETTGTATTDSGPSNKNGTLSTSTLRTLSGAPIGDEAAYYYPITSTPVMKLETTSGDTIKIVNVLGSAQGMHIYSVNSPPNSQNGIVTNCPGNRYFGVFPVMATANLVSYQVEYRNSGYSGALSFSRDDNADLSWSQNTVVPTSNGFNWNTAYRTEFITGSGPFANFNTNISGSLVQFANTSTSNSPITYNWNFGDGTTSTAQNPQHFFSPAGTYWVCLTATDTCGSQTYCDSITTTCSGGAAFGHQQTGTLQVGFFNQSVGAGTLQYLWNFGNGTTSTQANPTVNYAAKGTYWVCLQTTDTCGTYTYCDSVLVDCFNLNADYTYTQSNLTATFTNLSTGTAGMSYYWTFGDGGFTFTKDPVYTYQNEGTYQVCLQVTDSCDTRTTCYNLDMCLLPSPNFAVNNTTGFTFKFLPTTANAMSYIWNFGDGNFSSAPSPTYTYQNPGLYNVCMSLVDDCGDADTCIDVLASLFAVDENGISKAPVIYPNPTRDFISVTHLPGNSAYAFELTNALGQIVLHGKLEDKQPISVQSLPAGFYTIHITNYDGYKWKGKVIIE